MHFLDLSNGLFQLSTQEGQAIKEEILHTMIHKTYIHSHFACFQIHQFVTNKNLHINVFTVQLIELDNSRIG